MNSPRNRSNPPRRNPPPRPGMPGWAWMILGIVLAVGAMLGLPQLMHRKAEGFYKPEPDANAVARPTQPTEEAAAEPDAKPAAAQKPAGKPATAKAADAKKPADSYDFYDVLPNNEVKLSDAQLAALAQEEARRRARTAKADARKQAAKKIGAGASESTADAGGPTQKAAGLPKPIDNETPAVSRREPKPQVASADKDAARAAEAKARVHKAEAASSAARTASTAAAGKPTAHAEDAVDTPAPIVARVKTATGDVPVSKTVLATADTPYLLQAGAYAQATEAEALKARIAMLGLSARVESAEVAGKTVYRVRMGPYATAGQLAGAKSKLAEGGLTGTAIRSR